MSTPDRTRHVDAPTALDELDRSVLGLFTAEPRIGVLEVSRRLGVARGTVQTRLDRLQRSGIVTGWAPDISTSALGYPVTAFVTVEVAQDGTREALTDHLATIPELLECWTITGSGDLWCRIVARSNADLQRVLDALSAHPTVARTSTLIGLAEQIPFRTEPLVQGVGA
ncbi:Lrp/AsnC family transcriptional regulator [Propionibacteriaceae bacterium Y1685]|uniref:Lrp/AsnC family transcriptional regulator n=1 Tax=Microlunatus sp. Y1700 TaxID=3418487 RepID=UPI003B8256D7